ncbi:MAG: hypothetical protein JW794_08615 [Candidatus Cloacimonetes bacterium]|nr:hypothetical protein [Candidatus Cloacimonadota bacterium]
MIHRNHSIAHQNVKKIFYTLVLSILFMLLPSILMGEMPMQRYYYADIPSGNEPVILGIANNIIDFLSRAIPAWHVFFVLTPILIIFTWFCSWVASILKVKKGLKTAYTRKVFHFMIFSMAGILQIVIGLPGVILFGIIVVIVILFAVHKGSGFPFYEALARSKDSPRRSAFILIPLATTALGGVLANVFFYPFAYIGYFVCGCGDAVGEPIGAKWGKHTYKVPSMFGVKVTRSIEGSIGVLVVGFLAAFLALLFSAHDVRTSLFVGAICALGGALIEAVSTHGLDNVTIQLVVSGIAYIILH